MTPEQISNHAATYHPDIFRVAWRRGKYEKRNDKMMNSTARHKHVVGRLS